MTPKGTHTINQRCHIALSSWVLSDSEVLLCPPTRVEFALLLRSLLTFVRRQITSLPPGTQLHSMVIFSRGAAPRAYSQVLSLTLTGRQTSLRYSSYQLCPAVEYTKYTGRMEPLPDWIGDGAIVHSQGGGDKVRSDLAGLTAHNVSLAALWVEDWCGGFT